MWVPLLIMNTILGVPPPPSLPLPPKVPSAPPSDRRARRAWRWVPGLVLAAMNAAVYACVLTLVLLPATGSAAPFGAELSALGMTPVGAWCALVGYHALWALAALAAAMTARMAPGHIPLWLYSREPGDQAYFHNVLQAVEKKLDGSLRFCRKCGAFKPDLSHHSRELGMCILCYQHWDLWSNNAIGFYNHKAYLLSLLYGVLAHAAGLAMLLPGVLRHAHTAAALAGASSLGGLARRLLLLPMWEGGESAVLGFACLSVVASAAIGSGAALWLLFHGTLVARGLTAHSWFRQSGCMAQKPPKPRMQGRPFDFGLRGNFARACGKHPLLWLLPTNQGVEGNGIFFELNIRGGESWS